MAKPTAVRFMRRLARRMGEAGRRIALPKVRGASRTLAKNMVVKVERLRTKRLANVKATIHIPHYWAVYVHDGRKPFRKRKVMVWWQNPADDPRRQPKGSTPRRRKNLRRLTRSEYERAVAQRRAHIEAGGDPRSSPVIITKVVRKQTPPTPFFSNEAGGGMAGFRPAAGRIATAEFSRFVRQQLGEGFKERKEAKGRIGL